MKILWIHHFQECWTPGHPELRKMSPKLNAFIKRWQPYKIILTMFEEWRLEEIHHDVPALVNHPNLEIHEFGYAWELDEEGKYPYPYILGDRHSEIIPLDSWMDAFKQANKVALAGAFEGECLNDAETVLNHFNTRYFKPEHLTI